MRCRVPLRAIWTIAIHRRSRNLERLVNIDFHFPWKWRVLYGQTFLTTARAIWPGPWHFQVSLAFNVCHHDSQFIGSQLAPISSVHWSQRHRSLPTSSIVSPVRLFGKSTSIWWIYLWTEPLAEKGTKGCETASCNTKSALEIRPIGNLNSRIFGRSVFSRQMNAVERSRERTYIKSRPIHWKFQQKEYVR